MARETMASLQRRLKDAEGALGAEKRRADTAVQALTDLKTAVREKANEALNAGDVCEEINDVLEELGIDRLDGPIEAVIEITLHLDSPSPRWIEYLSEHSNLDAAHINVTDFGLRLDYETEEYFTNSGDGWIDKVRLKDIERIDNP